MLSTVCLHLDLLTLHAYLHPLVAVEIKKTHLGVWWESRWDFHTLAGWVPGGGRTAPGEDEKGSNSEVAFS